MLSRARRYMNSHIHHCIGIALLFDLLLLLVFFCIANGFMPTTEFVSFGGYGSLQLCMPIVCQHISDSDTSKSKNNEKEIRFVSFSRLTIEIRIDCRHTKINHTMTFSIDTYNRARMYGRESESNRFNLRRKRNACILWNFSKFFHEPYFHEVFHIFSPPSLSLSLHSLTFNKYKFLHLLLRTDEITRPANASRSHREMNHFSAANPMTH